MDEKKLVPKRRFSGFQNEGNWKQSRMKEVVDVYDGTHQTPRYTKSGVMFLSVENIHSLKSTKYISYEDFERDFKVFPEKDDVLMTRIGDIGTANVVESDESKAYYVTLALLKKRGLDPYFLKGSIRSASIRKELWHRTLHIAFPKKINMDEIGKVLLNYPEVPEQQKIGKFFKVLDERIANQKRKITKVKALKSAYLTEMFPQEGETVPKRRFKGFEGEWKREKLGNVAEYRRGSFPQPYGEEKWYDEVNGMPFVQVVDVAKNLRLVDNTKQKISKLAQPSSVYVEKGKVLVTLQGSIGRVAITQYPAYVDRTLLIFNNYKYKVDIYYYAYIIQLLFEIEKQKAPGGTIKTITKEALSEFIVKLPSYYEQQKIGQFFKNIDDQIEMEEKKLDKLQKMKEAYLEEMFV